MNFFLSLSFSIQVPHTLIWLFLNWSCTWLANAWFLSIQNMNLFFLCLFQWIVNEVKKEIKWRETQKWRERLDFFFHFYFMIEVGMVCAYVLFLTLHKQKKCKMKFDKFLWHHQQISWQQCVYCADGLVVDFVFIYLCNRPLTHCQ